MPTKKETKGKEKKPKVAKAVPVRTGRDQSWRPIMFSRNTAMFTIPSEVRDKANLTELHEKGIGARVTYDEGRGVIVIQPGVEKPEEPEAPTRKTKETEVEEEEADESDEEADEPEEPEDADE